MSPQRAHHYGVRAEDCRVVTFGLARYNGAWLVLYKDGSVLTEGGSEDPYFPTHWVGTLSRLDKV